VAETEATAPPGAGPAPTAGGPRAGELPPARYPSFLAQVLRIVVKDLRI